MDRSSRQKISKEIYIQLHPTTAEYRFFSSSHRTVTRQTIFWAIKQISKDVKALKKMQIMFCFIMESIRLDLNKIKNTEKSLNPWKLNNILLKTV